ncbi:DUF6266 family protein [Pedobacter deserti]|uniref:DUF6266 family protein n=1 Tax=Pedobacter deserti TaxID=2817382 RepID=UPI002109A4B0|nr:DUF6266 family protein [Pedobacter sp. SYSU D00382]
MARLINGLLGGLSGKAGDFEGYIRNGKYFIRKRRRKSTKKPSVKQAATRRRMAVISRFLGSMTPYIRVGFKLDGKLKGITANNAAKSYQLLHATQGEYPSIEMVYSKARLTQGNLTKPVNPAALIVHSSILLTWEQPSALSWYERNAQIMLLVYSPEIDQSMFKIGGACNHQGGETMELPQQMKNTELHVYCSFIGYDHQQISDSVYVGMINWH